MEVTLITNLNKMLWVISFALLILLPISVKSAENSSKKEASKLNKYGETKVYGPVTLYEILKKDFPQRRIFLEKYFLLIQKEKLEKLNNPSPRIEELKKFIKRQLRIIERKLKRKSKYSFQQDYT